MPAAIPHYADMHAETPDLDEARAQTEGFLQRIADASSADEVIAVVGDWDQLRRTLNTWSALATCRYHQDTRDQAHQAERERVASLSPKVTELHNRVKSALLDSPFRSELERTFGAQAFAKWEADRKSFDPRISDDLVAETNLASEYTSLKAQAVIPFQGESYNLSSIVKHFTVADRATREAAQRAHWGWYEANAGELDRIFDEQVKLRHGMAKKLGFENFIELGYLLKHRIDYGQAEVEAFRAQIREQIVPLCVELYREQAERLGVDPMMYWDEKVFDPRGNPVPAGGHDWMMERAQEMFDAIGHGMGGFFAMLREHGLMDLKARDGKAGGGFCTNFMRWGTPFIFANFNGTQNDARVFTHEVGHAFQKYMSRDQRLIDYHRATSESAEVHSMSLEYITWPWMEDFFGKEEGARFRQVHLAQALEFLPYGTAVDHFQHLVYANPDATPDERAEMWQQMERTYLPWRNYGDLPHLPRGRQWQAQQHIYRFPFYYIDYVLANVCALQFWVRSEEDREAAMQAYTALCARGGEAPFQELVTSAGLTSPFDAGCLSRVANHARDWLAKQE